MAMTKEILDINWSNLGLEAKLNEPYSSPQSNQTGETFNILAIAKSS